MKIRRGFIYILILSFYSAAGWCSQEDIQQFQLRFKALTIDHGLSYNKVNAVVQDTKGFIWLATNEGLNRYDGLSFQIYRSDTKDSTTISNNFIISLHRGVNGSLWIGTFNGLNFYNPVQSSFECIKYLDNNEGLGTINSIDEDNDSNLWISTQNGIAIIYKGNKYASRFIGSNELALLNDVTCMYIDDKILWVGTRGKGLYSYNLESELFHHYKLDRTKKYSLSGNWITILYKDSKNRFWIGTNDNGINQYNFKSNNFTHLAIDLKHPFSTRVRDVQEDSLGRLWIGTRAGLYLLTDDTGKYNFIHYAHNKHDKSKISNNSIYDIYIDKHNLMWLGTFAGGVNYADFNQKKFRHFSAMPNNNNYLNNSLVYAILEDNDGGFWVGTELGGLNHYVAEDNKFHYSIHKKGNKNSINSNNVKSMVHAENGEIWVATYKGGLNLFYPEKETFKHFKVRPGEKGFLQTSNVSILFKDSKRNLWIGHDIGVQIKKFNSNSFITIPLIKDGDTIKRNLLVISFYEDKKGDVWIGSWGEGIFKIKSGEKVARYFDLISDNKIIYGFNEDVNENLWICSESGLYCIKNKTDTIYYYTDKEGLPANNVYIALDDNYGNLWISTASGLSMFKNAVTTPEKPDFKNYDVNDGLQSKLFWYNSYHKGKSGNLYFGGVNGLNVFKPERILNNPYKPDVVINKLRIFNKEVKIGSEVEGSIILNSSIETTKEIKLTHRQYVFSLEFAALHFVSPEKNKYAYKLENFDKDWNYTGWEKRSATYSNLEGGEYIFKVKAANNDGIWGDPVQIKVIVYPPFWETLWFKVLILFIMAMFAFSLNLLRVINLKKQKEKLEENVELRTKKLKETNYLLTKQKETIAKSYNHIKILSEFGQKLTSSLKVEDINKMTFGYIGEIMDVTNFGIALFNVDYNTLDFHGLIEEGKPLPFFFFFLSDETSCAAICFKKQKTIFSNDFLNEYKKFINELNIRTTIKPRSVIYHPLTVEDKKIGIITVQSYKEKAYKKYDVNIIKTLASYIAIALDNANFYNELFLKTQRLQTQTGELNDTNTQLEERQQLIEEQSEELQAQKEELHIRYEEIQEANNTKDKLFSIIAHDLKNPFSSILGFSDLILNRFDNLSKEKIKFYVQNLNSSTKVVYKLLDNMLSWSRSQRGDIKILPERLNLREIVGSNIQLLENLANEKNISLNTKFVGDPSCIADKNTINTVVRNLLSNAIKYSGEGEIVCSVIEDVVEKNLLVSVTDNGIGIEEDRLHDVFDVGKSKSTEGTKGEQGTGLGLIICKEFVEKNNGNIYVESTVGKGTTFTFTLPISES